MTNADGATKLIDELLNSVAETYAWPRFLEERATIPLGRSVLDRYVGEYAVSPDYVIRVRRDGDALLAAAPNVGEGELYAESAGVFFALEIPVKLAFEGDGGGAHRLTVRGDGFELLARRI